MAIELSRQPKTISNTNITFEQCFPFDRWISFDFISMHCSLQSHIVRFFSFDREEQP